MNIPSSFAATQAAPGIASSSTYMSNIFSQSGLYDKKTIDMAKFSRYTRFGRVLDGHGRLNNTTEYLFFTKMDLHLTENTDNTRMVINPELSHDPYFVDLVNYYPDIVRELQKSAAGNTDKMFSHLMSFCVNNSLDLPGIESTTIDTPATIYGTSIEYPGNAEASDENHSFSLEFIDSRNLELYHFFKAYQEYQIARKSGTVTPIRSYTWQRRLHNTMGAYKFLVAEDMETIIYWAYLWNVFPTSAPREAFSDPTFPDGLTYSVNFKATFVEDSNPKIIVNFNNLMSNICNTQKSKNKQNFGTEYIPISKLSNEYGHEMIRDLPMGAQIVQSTAERGWNGRPKYKLLWY